ncbi:EcsC family protein [Clostridium sp. MD294]|uniref:EcsC family protein n=1 Tax=Clostridium sp. MD294 TaxID=97138 RepID=UPI0002CC619B|nr:EcsC family protein [Clostridium sp. MD294]NDO47794.1 EcsC family protein [Clostridium sp. MD294]USF29886.1 hypothetical protein C820_001294 [Clostridium sp. MD294]
MNDVVKKQLEKIEKKEKKYLSKKENRLYCKKKAVEEMIEQKVPEKVKQAIEKAFFKGFLVLLEKGTSVIEKTYDKEKILWQHQFYENRFEQNRKNRQFQKIVKNANQCNRINIAITAVEGGVLGVLGIGLPDIPLFLAIILKGIYQTALQYGFDYNDKREQIYILRLIRAAMIEQKQKVALNILVEETAMCIEKEIAVPYNFEEEVKQTSQLLSHAMLTAKMIQGVPVIGVAGSGYNAVVYHTILKYCNIKYKKRYLQKKNKE